MIYRYGNYTSAVQEGSISVTRKPIETELGTVIGYTETHRFDAIVQADTYSALNTAIKKIERDFSVKGRDAGLYLENGTTRTHIFLQSSNCMGGTRVTQFPSFTKGTGAELSTFRSYTVEIQGDVLTVGGNPILSWSEEFDTVGTGGGDWVKHWPVVGKAIKHYTSEKSPVIITQKGSAVGLRGYPTPPNPLHASEMKPRQHRIFKGNPRRRNGLDPSQMWEHPITWSYTFELG